MLIFLNFINSHLYHKNKNKSYYLYILSNSIFSNKKHLVKFEIIYILSNIINSFFLYFIFNFISFKLKIIIKKSINRDFKLC